MEQSPAKKSKRAFRAKIGIIDDDSIVTAIMGARLRSHFPKCSVEIINEPKVPPMLDIYFVDNDFGGEFLATQILTDIRRLNPEALVVAISGSLKERTLRDLMNGGCNAVYDKNHPEDLAAIFQILQNYLGALAANHDARGSRSPFADTVESIRALLSEWNQRLDPKNR